ncbi:hypothetical protein KZX46_06090 [Polymorphobacter sp. PAMC 29334]|uniref:hypothetical protein n=1 Tax=Polymorphobacter sp. PAMC 29334 TaxID=2862331 RepID=UPI001C751CB4|nr:hypothetical protein [Polymorphobacter sp. PAMC 29334]QYE35542.1 hypothetical protein KZX46_06090 [Polymorphobacter sp. PAMC 29334]
MAPQPGGGGGAGDRVSPRRPCRDGRGASTPRAPGGGGGGVIMPAGPSARQGPPGGGGGGMSRVAASRGGGVWALAGPARPVNANVAIATPESMILMGCFL